MHFSTASRKSNQDSTTGVFVALYLILLAFFILLTKDLSFDDDKKTIAMRSVGETFGRPQQQEVAFGRMANVKIEDYALKIEKIIKAYGAVTINTDQDKLQISIPLSAIYFGDESDFRNERMDDMMALTSLLQNWTNVEQLHISANLTETNFALDQQRLDFWRKRIYGEKPMIGLKIDTKNNLEITIERDI